MTENEYYCYKQKKLQDRMEANRREHQELCAEQKLLDQQLAETAPNHTEGNRKQCYLPFLQKCLDGVTSNTNGTLRLNWAGCRYTFTWGDCCRYEAYKENGYIFWNVTEPGKPVSTEEIDERFQGKTSKDGEMCGGAGYV